MINTIDGKAYFEIGESFREGALTFTTIEDNSTTEAVDTCDLCPFRRQACEYRKGDIILDVACEAKDREDGKTVCFIPIDYTDED